MYSTENRKPVNAMEIGNLQTHSSCGWFSQIEDGSIVVLLESCFFF
jgi:hypothetical protein